MNYFYIFSVCLKLAQIEDLKKKVSFPEEREEEDVGSKREVELKGEVAYKSHEGSFGSSRDGEWGQRMLHLHEERAVS